MPIDAIVRVSSAEVAVQDPIPRMTLRQRDNEIVLGTVLLREGLNVAWRRPVANS